MEEILGCNLCPRNCNVIRTKELGFCRAGKDITAAKAFLHRWEEPCISGDRGSGTVFFSNCNLRCVFCQNYKISQEGIGKDISIERLSQIFIELQDRGAHNINLVSPTPYIFHIVKALKMAKGNGLTIPTIYNSSGYESVEALKVLDGFIDVYLPDLKYCDKKYGEKYSYAGDYFEYASKAIIEMYRQVGDPVFENGIIKKGLMIRHLMLPGLLFDSKKVVDWVVNNLPSSVYLNIMCQYTPLNKADKYSEIDKKLNKKHYESLLDYAVEKGIKNGFFQDFNSATDEYVPDFNMEGI